MNINKQLDSLPDMAVFARVVDGICQIYLT